MNAGFKASGLIGKFVKLTVFLLLAVTMALEQLGIGRGTIIIAFAIIFGGIVLALAIAFGLGGRNIAKDYLEKKLLKGEGRMILNIYDKTEAKNLFIPSQIHSRISCSVQYLPFSWP